MSQAIKTISLDDEGDTHAAADPQRALHYNPQYTKFPSMTEDDTKRGAAVTNLSETGIDTATGMFGTAATRISDFFGENASKKRIRLYFIAGGLALALGAAFYYMTMTESTTELPIADEPATDVDDVMRLRKEKAAKAAEAVASSIVKKGQGDPLINPYWSMPNPLEAPAAAGDSLSQSQEERWRFALNHPLTYQRYKAVKDIRSAHLKGSEFILTEALSQPKFWTRMEALLAMAELGDAVDIDTVEGAIGNTRRSLVMNYFRRFRRQASGSEIYIMRQSVRVVDAAARSVILHNLALRRDPINDLYLVAAAHDPNEKVKLWAQRELQLRPAAPEIVARFDRLLSGAEHPPASKEGGAQGSEATEVDTNAPPAQVEEVYFLNEDASPPKAREEPVETSTETMQGN